MNKFYFGIIMTVGSCFTDPAWSTNKKLEEEQKTPAVHVLETLYNYHVAPHASNPEKRNREQAAFKILTCQTYYYQDEKVNTIFDYQRPPTKNEALLIVKICRDVLDCF